MLIILYKSPFCIARHFHTLGSLVLPQAYSRSNNFERRGLEKTLPTKQGFREQLCPTRLPAEKGAVK